MSYYYFWGLWYLFDRPSKRGFPKISETGVFEKCFDFASSFLLSRFCSDDKCQCFKPSLCKNIIYLMSKPSLFIHSIWKYKPIRWIWVEKILKIENCQNGAHRIWSAILAHSVLVGSWYTIKSIQYLNFMLYIQTRISNERSVFFFGTYSPYTLLFCNLDFCSS